MAFIAVRTLPDDCFFCNLLYTLVNGLLDIFFGCTYFTFRTFLETLVFTNFCTVKCCHIGLLCFCASSFTLFMLWSILLAFISIAISLVANSCLLVLILSFHQIFLVHLLVVPFLSLCIIEWFSLITSVFCYYYLPSQYQCVSVSMHLSVGPHFFYKQYCKLEETMECFCFVPLLSFVSLLFSLLLFSSSFDFLHT